jgi:2-oxoglutarate ferredoxin oxidoreductase subunit beta
VLQPCISFNKLNTYAWYKERVRELPPDYDPRNWDAAMRTAAEWGEHIPIGVLYRGNRPAYETVLPGLKAGPLVERALDPGAIAPLFARFEAGT